MVKDFGMKVSELIALFEAAEEVELNGTPEETEAAFVKAYEAIEKVEGLAKFQEKTDMSSNDLLEAIRAGALKPKDWS